MVGYWTDGYWMGTTHRCCCMCLMCTPLPTQTVKPRTTPATSIPGLLGLFQNVCQCRVIDAVCSHHTAVAHTCARYMLTSHHPTHVFPHNQQTPKHTNTHSLTHPHTHTSPPNPPQNTHRNGMQLCWKPTTYDNPSILSGKNSAMPSTNMMQPNASSLA